MAKASAILAKKRRYCAPKTPEAAARQALHQFGQPGANPSCPQSIATNQREFYRWVESIATINELHAYEKDVKNPIMRRNFVKAVLNVVNSGDPDLYFAMTNQTHGAPKQPIEVLDLPKVQCEFFGDE